MHDYTSKFFLFLYNKSDQPAVSPWAVFVAKCASYTNLSIYAISFSHYYCIIYLTKTTFSFHQQPNRPSCLHFISSFMKQIFSKSNINFQAYVQSFHDNHSTIYLLRLDPLLFIVAILLSQDIYTDKH